MPPETAAEVATEAPVESEHSLAEWASQESEARPTAPKSPAEVKPEAKGRDERGRFTAPLEDGEKPPETKPESEKPPEKRYKLKVRGQEREVDEATLLRLAQRADGADARFEESAKARKDADALLQKLKADPAAALKHLGLDVKDFAEKWLYDNVIAPEAQTPEQRRVAELERQLKEKEAKEAQAKGEEEERAKEAEMERVREELQADVLKAMEKTGLPKHSVALALVANILEAKYLRDDLDYSAEDAAQEVADLLADLTQKRIFSMKPEEFVKAAPKAWLDGIRKYDIDQAKLGPRTPAPKVPARPKKAEVGEMSERQAREALEKWAEGG